MKRADPREFGRRLRQRMKALGIGQSELARALGMKGNSTVFNWMEGHLPRPDRLDQLVEALSTTRNWLLYDEGPEEAGGTPVEEKQIREAVEPLTAAQKRFLLRLAKNMAA